MSDSQPTNRAFDEWKKTLCDFAEFLRAHTDRIVCEKGNPHRGPVGLPEGQPLPAKYEQRYRVAFASLDRCRRLASAARDAFDAAGLRPPLTPTDRANPVSRVYEIVRDIAGEADKKIMANEALSGAWASHPEYGRPSPPPAPSIMLPLSPAEFARLCDSAIKAALGPAHSGENRRRSKEHGQTLTKDGKIDVVKAYLREHAPGGWDGTLEDLARALQDKGLNVSDSWLSRHGFARRRRGNPHSVAKGRREREALSREAAPDDVDRWHVPSDD